MAIIRACSSQHRHIHKINITRSSTEQYERTYNNNRTCTTALSPILDKLFLQRGRELYIEAHMSPDVYTTNVLLGSTVLYNISELIQWFARNIIKRIGFSCQLCIAM